VLIVFTIFVEFPPSLQVFQGKVKSRIKGAYRPSTIKSQTLAVRTLATFCNFYEVNFPATLLSFVEFLADNKLAPCTIKNYISSIKSTFRWIDMDVSQFESNFFVKAGT
jgi:hypothetical protein